MSKENYSDIFLKNQRIYRRTVITASFYGLFFGIITLRLIYLQIIQYRRYLSLSNINRYRINFIPAIRGRILDCNDIEIAYSKISYWALFDPTVNSNKIETIRYFFNILGNTDRNIEDFISKQSRKIRIYNSHTPMVLHQDLTYDQIARIEFNLEYMPGIWIEKTTTRVYPFKQHLANITGYISTPTPYQLERADTSEKRLYKNYNFKIGQIGIEAIKENELRGQFGITLKEVNAIGEVQNEINHLETQNGKDIKLTIHTGLQEYISNLLNGIAGSIIVSNIKTGDILAMQSSPCFDPNDMLKGVNEETWKKLNDPKLGYLTNKAIYGSYQPGSTFKQVTVLAALINGFDPYRTITCTGEYQYGNRTFHCHKKEGHGALNMIEALACSCNIYFYEIGNFLTIEQIAEVAKLLGFNKKVDLGIGSESKGLIPDSKWKIDTLHQKWIPSETIMSGIGQSYVQVTLMQLNNMITQIASGYLMRNRIMFNDKTSLQTPLPIPTEFLDLVRKGNRMAFTHKYGTSRSAAEYQHKYEMAGKTGTAQVISKRFTMAEMLSGSVPKHQMPHGLYVGYAPYSDPHFSVTAMIEHGMTGVIALRYAEKALAYAMDSLT